MIQVDGSFGEGGGSVLRQALALSILTGKEFNIKNIRVNREKPGLSHQHLASLDLAVQVCGATVTGNSLGSTEVYFKPGDYKSGTYKLDIGTAGSITLLLQSVLLPAVFSKKKTTFVVSGGTDVSWSSPFDYFKWVFLPQLRRFADVDAGVFKRGYYPQGNGEVKVSVNSKFSRDDFLPSIILTDRQKLLQVRGVSHASLDLQQARVSERQTESFILRMKNLGVHLSVSDEYSASASTGSGLCAWAVYGGEDIDFSNPVILGSSSLGERGKKAETVGLDAADKLYSLIESGACADEHLCDQLIPYLGIAEGLILTSEITEHVRSNIYVTELFMDCKFTLDGNLIKCKKLLF